MRRRRSSPRYKRFVMDLQSALARDTTRARAMLQEIFGAIRLVNTGEELYAEFEAPLERLLLSAGGALLGRVAGTCNLTQKRIRIS